MNGRLIRLTMKPGVSVLRTGVLPQPVDDARARRRPCGSVLEAATTSTRAIAGDRVEEVQPDDAAGVLATPAMAATDSALVLVARIAFGEAAAEGAEDVLLGGQVLGDGFDREGRAVHGRGGIGRDRQARRGRR